MKTGIKKLDKLLGEVPEGSMILIETVGTLGEEIAVSMLQTNKEKAVAFVTSQLREEFEKRFNLREIEMVVLGRDMYQEELYKISYILRNVPEGSSVGFFLLHPLLVFQSSSIVFRLFSELVTIVQEKKAVMVVLLDKRLINSKSLAVFENYATHVIDIIEEVDEFKITRGLRIKKSPGGGTDFYEFDIINGEVIIGNPII
ncbi:hypothetical protein E3E26_10550 [Thermococcus sp. LS1]|uniref:hypothetical protein n=1 Tax=Thermococcus sp. LS1 TaxID=1638259 RepID=UPI00143A89FF|nr:hypothetical protein [Thermococcus sp. LS1]NJE00209.1 hypothetical protein [Thermococcus sp. LS1]